jgi:hypothetical protein
MHPTVGRGIYPGIHQMLQARAALLQLAGDLEMRAIRDNGAGTAVVDDELEFGNG